MRTMKLSELEAHIEGRKAELGLSGGDCVLANSGKFRSAEKCDLLRATAEQCAEQGKVPPFQSEFTGGTGARRKDPR